jgi:hypothetical protein
MLRSGRTRVATTLAVLAGIGAMAVASPSAHASGEFCSNHVSITSHDDGLYLGGLEIGVWQSSNPGWTKVHVWSSDGRYDVWTGGAACGGRGDAFQLSLDAGRRACQCGSSPAHARFIAAT